MTEKKLNSKEGLNRWGNMKEVGMWNVSLDELSFVPESSRKELSLSLIKYRLLSRPSVSAAQQRLPKLTGLTEDSASLQIFSHPLRR